MRVRHTPSFLCLMLTSKIALGRAWHQEEAAMFLGISKSALYKMTHNHVIPYFKPNNKMIYKKAGKRKCTDRAKATAQHK